MMKKEFRKPIYEDENVKVVLYVGEGCQGSNDCGNSGDNCYLGQECAAGASC